MADHPLLKPVSQNKRFFLSDGTAISSLRELAARLPAISETMYKNHVNGSKNDFFNWVTHVIRDTHLSKEMKDVKDQAKLAKLISKRVAELEARDARQEISRAVAMQQGTTRQSGQSSPAIKQSNPPGTRPTSSSISSSTIKINPALLPPPRPLSGQQFSRPPGQGASPSFQPRASTPLNKPAQTNYKPAQTNQRFSPPMQGVMQGFKPLNTPRQERPRVPGSSMNQAQPTSHPFSKPSPRPPSGSADTIRRKAGTNRPSSFGFGESSQGSSGKPVLIDLGEESKAGHEDVPKPPPAYYANQDSPPPSLWPKPENCDHAKHFSCMRCGMLEFGIGLTIGIITTLMFAKAFL